MNSLLDLDHIREQPWYDEWWIFWGNGFFCDSQHRSEQTANEYLAKLQAEVPDTDAWIEHIHIEDGHVPFSESVRPCGALMWPIDRSELLNDHI